MYLEDNAMHGIKGNYERLCCRRHRCDHPLNPRSISGITVQTALNGVYGGSGPAQLALALLADHLADDEERRLPHEFKYALFAALAHQSWMLHHPGNLTQAVEEIEISVGTIEPGIIGKEDLVGCYLESSGSAVIRVWDPLCAIIMPAGVFQAVSVRAVIHRIHNTTAAGMSFNEGIDMNQAPARQTNYREAPAVIKHQNPSRESLRAAGPGAPCCLGRTDRGCSSHIWL